MSQPIRINCPAVAGRLALFVPLLAYLFPLSSMSAQCTLTCNQNLSVSLDNTGQATITTQLIAPNAASSCPGPLELKLYTAQGVPLINPLNCSNIGQTITATVRHLSTGNSCSGSIEVQDALPPVLSCPDKTVLCNQDASVAALGLPTMSDNCTLLPLLDYQFFDTETDLGCSGLHAGYPVIRRIDRHWTVSDQHDNSSSCVQKIWLRRTIAGDVVFPPNHDGFALPPLACGQDPNDLELSGQPTIAGQPIDNGGFCELGITYSDQTINQCLPAGYTVVRSWTLIEFCTSTITQRIQLIKVEDKTPPIVTAPANLTVGTYGYSCSATVSLPAATATDNCSTVTTSATWEYGSGFGPFTGVALGSHVVTYRATDACGNSAATTALVTVVDNSPPTAICTAALQVAVSSSGSAFVNASAMDGGSYDQCGTISLAVSRDDVTYAPGLEVSCAEVGTTLSLFLRATDEVGLENFCTVEVSVRDFLKPVLLCPGDVTLNCQQDYRLLSLTGQATATDNCALQSLDSTHVVTLDGCHLGAITRIWKATDAAANTKICTQHITMAPVNTMTVVFPPNITINSCSSASSTVPAATGQPTITGQSCFAPSVTFSDQLFQIAPPACFRIIRTWEVIDFCIHNPNGGTAGYWSGTQVIDVRDNVAPELSIPADVTVSPDQAGCMAQINLPDATATDCSTTVTITHNSAYAAAGQNASGLYPVGLHTVVFSAGDGCGNVAQRTLHITVQDESAPAAVCINGLAVNMGPNGQYALAPTLLNGGSSDNCTPSDELTFIAFPSILTCQNLGYQQVVLTVGDNAGNYSTCHTLVNVQDNGSYCGTFLHAISGSIRMPGGQALAEIPVEVTGDGLQETTDCDITGHYVFSDLPVGSYILRPANNAKWLNGVSTYDLVLISRHILGVQTLTSPYKILAADANRSGSVTTFDILQLRKLILGIYDTVPGSTSWRFLPANYTFADSLNPFTTALPEVITLASVTQDQINQDFIGIKLGDLNDNTNAADPRSPQDTAWLDLPDLSLLPNVPVAVPLVLKNWSALSGFQFEMLFDQAQLELESTELSPGNALNYSHFAQSGRQSLAVSWDNGQQQVAAGDSMLLILHILPKRGGSLRQSVRLRQENLRAEAYAGEELVVGPLALRFPTATGPGRNAKSGWQAFPNPFSEEVTFTFELAEPGEVHLLISDALGRPVFVQKADLTAGHQQWRVPGSALPGAGAYICRLETSGQRITGGVLIFAH